MDRNYELAQKISKAMKEAQKATKKALEA